MLAHLKKVNHALVVEGEEGVVEEEEEEKTLEKRKNDLGIYGIFLICM